MRQHPIFILKAIKLALRLSRRIFGPKLPHYVKDLLGAVRYLNFFRLIPTIYVMLFYTRHFFKIVPSITRGAKPYYVTPVQFAANIITLQVVIFGLFIKTSSGSPPAASSISSKISAYINWEYLMIAVGNAILAVLSPATIAVACLILLSIWFIISKVQLVGHLAAQINRHGLILPIEAETYASLDWRRYVWSMLYYYCYFYVSFAATAVVFGSILKGFGLSGFRVPWVGSILYGLIFLAFTAVCYALFIRPYVHLLLAASREKTPRMRKFEKFTPPTLDFD